MTPSVFQVIAGLSLLVVAGYVIRCLKTNAEFDMSTVVVLVLQSGGIVGGGLLISSAFFEEAKELVQQYDLYAHIAGLVVLLTCGRGACTQIFGSRKK